MSTADEIIVKLTAQDGGLNAGMDEAAAKVKASTDAMQASVSNAMNTFRDFDNIQKGSIKTAQDVANAQATLTAAQATGAYTTEELAAKQAILDAAMAKLPREMEDASNALGKFTSNSRVMGEVSTIMSEAAAGNFGRIRRSAAALANQAGLLQLAFTPLGLAIEAVAGSIGILVAAEIEAGQHMAELDQAIIQSGNYAGTTADEIASLAQRMQHSGTDIDAASEALRRLVGTGQVTHAELVNVAQGVVDFSTVTQSKVEEAVKVFAELGKDPVKASAKLNESLNYLTSAQFDQIQSLEKEGETTKAAQAAMEALASALRPRAQQMQQDASDVARKWKIAWDAISGHGEIAEASATQAMQGRLAAINKELTELAAHGGHEVNMLAPGGVSADAVSQQYVQKLETEKASLVAQIKAAGDAAAAQAKAAADVQQHIANAMKIGNKTVKDGDEAGLQQLEYAAQQQGHEMSLAEQKAYWQQRYNIEKDGGAAEAQNAQAAMGKIVAIQKQIDEKAIRSAKEASRQAAEAQRKDNAATMQALEVKRAATQEYSAQRIAMDAQIVATAEKLYGHDSAQYRAALQQKLSDTQQFINRQKELAVSQADSDRQIAEAKIANAREQAQTEFDAGRITASQLLQTELDLDRQKLAADIAYYNAKKQLDINDVKATLEDNKQIVLAKLSADQQMQKDEQKFFKDSEKNWKQYSQRIAGAVQNATNSILFQHQSLRSGLASIAESIGETFIEAAVMKPLEKWIAAEGEKLTASLTTMTTQSTAEETQRATNTAADIADKTAGVIRAAGLAGAQGTASFAAAPWPIDIGAPAFGVAMAATAASFASMASAEHGWERVPADGMMTQLHKDEMVLPAHVANPVRDMAKRGGGSGDEIHNHFHLTDTRGLKDLLRRNRGLLADAAKHMKRNGYRV